MYGTCGCWASACPIGWGLALVSRIIITILSFAELSFPTFVKQMSHFFTVIAYFCSIRGSRVAIKNDRLSVRVIVSLRKSCRIVRLVSWTTRITIASFLSFESLTYGNCFYICVREIRVSFGSQFYILEAVLRRKLRARRSRSRRSLGLLKLGPGWLDPLR